MNNIWPFLNFFNNWGFESGFLGSFIFSVDKTMYLALCLGTFAGGSLYIYKSFDQELSEHKRYFNFS